MKTFVKHVTITITWLWKDRWFWNDECKFAMMAENFEMPRKEGRKEGRRVKWWNHGKAWYAYFEHWNSAMTTNVTQILLLLTRNDIKLWPDNESQTQYNLNMWNVLQHLRFSGWFTHLRQRCDSYNLLLDNNYDNTSSCFVRNKLWIYLRKDEPSNRK